MFMAKLVKTVVHIFKLKRLIINDIQILTEDGNHKKDIYRRLHIVKAR